MLKKVLKYIYLLITLIISIYFVFICHKINILPNKYFITIIIIISIVNILNIVLMHIKKIWPKIISIVLGIIIITISIIGSIYLNKTNNFLDKSFNNNTKEITTYNLISLKDKYDDIYKLDDKKIGYFIEENHLEESLNKITNLIKTTNIKYEDVYELYESLLNKKIQAILIDSAYMDILQEEDKDIEEKTEVLYSFEIETQIEKQEESVKDLKPINIYISGSDSRSKTIYNKSRSDVNMILTINPNTKHILMTSIPRDYYVQVHGQTGLKDKLTHSGIYGLEVSKKTLEDLFDINIDYSVKINFNAVTKMVDLVDGIEVYSDITFNSYHKKGWVVKKGWNYMDGTKALAYSRERYAYASGDRHRIQNQQQVLEAVFKKAMKDKKLLLQYDELLDSLSNLYRTTVPREVITLFIKEQLNTMSTWTFDSYWVNGSNASLPTHTAPRSKRYVMIPNEEHLKKANEKINNVLNAK